MTEKLNIQGLSRKFQPLMECLVPEPGHVFVSVDLSAGEPTIVSHFSKDTNYYNATFGMVGKAPYYDDNEVLQIDDIYLMGMSVSPMGKDKLKGMYENGCFVTKNAVIPFSEQWCLDKNLILKELKSERAFHKILILGLGYSMGPKHMVESAYKAGYQLSMKDARAFFKAYWEVLFPKVAELRDKLEAKFIKQGYLVNPFGYRLYPDPSYKALNYFIQSSVNGIIDLLWAKFSALYTNARFVTIIHDEILLEIPETEVELAREKMQAATDSLNEDLRWDVLVRTGWAIGRNLYEAK